MSTSTDAYLFYGVMLDEDTDFLNEENDWDWERLYMIKLGIKEPDYTNDNKNYVIWRDKKNKIIKELGIDVVSHCSGDYPMYAVIIKETYKTAWRGSPVQIHSLDYSVHWAKKINKFCEFMGIEINSKIGWWLCSYWG